MYDLNLNSFYSLKYYNEITIYCLHCRKNAAEARRIDDKEDTLKAQDEKYKHRNDEIDKRLQVVKEKEDDVHFAQKQHENAAAALEEREEKMDEQVSL